MKIVVNPRGPWPATCEVPHAMAQPVAMAGRECKDAGGGTGAAGMRGAGGVPGANGLADVTHRTCESAEPAGLVARQRQRRGARPFKGHDMVPAGSRAGKCKRAVQPGPYVRPGPGCCSGLQKSSHVV